MKEIIIIVIAGLILLIATHFLSWCSIKNIKLLNQVLSLMKLIPPELNLNCKGNKVYVVSANGVDEKWIYTGIYTWQDDKKMNVRIIKEKIESMKSIKVISLVVTIILSTVSIYLGLTKNLGFFIIPAFTLVEQFYPFYIGPDIFGIAQEAL
jgi:hypothetical protein